MTAMKLDKDKELDPQITPFHNWTHKQTQCNTQNSLVKPMQ